MGYWKVLELRPSQKKVVTGACHWGSILSWSLATPSLSWGCHEVSSLLHCGLLTTVLCFPTGPETMELSGHGLGPLKQPKEISPPWVNSTICCSGRKLIDMDRRRWRKYGQEMSNSVLVWFLLFILGDKFRTSCMLGRYSTTELHSPVPGLWILTDQYKNQKSSTFWTDMELPTVNSMIKRGGKSCTPRASPKRTCPINKLRMVKKAPYLHLITLYMCACSWDSTTHYNSELLSRELLKR